MNSKQTFKETYVLDGVAKYSYYGKGHEGFSCGHVKGDPSVHFHKVAWGALCVVCSKRLGQIMCMVSDKAKYQ